jgi:putative ABC transport system ATP-binding protein
LIELQGISRTFQVGNETVHALQDVNLAVQPGGYLAVMGPSGSGKSTLLNIVGLLDRPDEGLYLLDKQDTTELSDRQQASVRRHKIGFVFQFFHLVPRLTAAENVELPLILAGFNTEERKQRVRQALSALGIADRARHRPDQLSGGQRQRVAIARATIMQPGIVLADEPTGNLDRASGREVLDILENLNQQGMSLIMVTHDPELGRRASRRIEMLDGRIQADTERNHEGI